MNSKNLCRITASLVLFFGLLGSFFWAKAYGMQMGLYKLERNWTITIGIFMTGLIMICIVVSVLFGIAAIIEIQEQNNYCLRNIAKALEGKARDSNLYRDSQGTENGHISNGWKCKKCGKFNAAYVGTCSCGNTKEE